jgi:LysM repeat protein
MIIRCVRPRWLGSIGLCLSLCGCLPSTPNPADEEKEPYFQRGKALATGLDYKGAIEAYEKALEVNPQNGRAFFELGLLFQRDDADLPAAIYHFERFLRLRPNSEQADVARQQISAAKQGMARAISISMAPVVQTMQRDLERVTADNTRLTAENQEYRRQLEAWQVYYSRNPTGVLQTTNSPSASGPGPAGATAVSTNRAVVTQPVRTNVARTGPGPAAKTYVVKRGESFYTIAKNHGVKLAALLQANPGVDPKKLKAGQAVVIPVP